MISWIKIILILLLISFLLETFVFNFNYFESLGNDEIDLENEIDLPIDPNDNFRLTSYDHTLEFHDLNKVVKNIRIDLPLNQPAQVVDFSIHFTDEAHLTYFDSTEYTVGIPNVEVSTTSYESQFINLNTAGYVQSLKIEVVGDANYPIELNTIYLNAHHPFNFNLTRYAAVTLLLFLIYIFRPRSSIYSLKIVSNPKLSKTAIIFTVIIECSLISAFLFYGSNLVGVSTQSYNYGDWDGSSIVNTYEVGGENAQQYAMLAESIASGKLYLEVEPPQWLKDMDEPYDKGARDEAQKETGEDYLFDVAYYDGHYYVYFGIIPVLLFYLPFYLITKTSFPTAIGVLIAVLAFVLGITALLDRFARYHFKKVSLGLYLLLQITTIFCSGILYLVKFPTFYSLPIACGLAFSVWGIYFWMRGRISSHKKICFLIGSICMAVVAGCRPQLLLLSLLAFPIFWKSYITKRRILTKNGIQEFICLIAPFVVFAMLIMTYNYLRFGSFTDFGANYNLTVNDMTKRGWNIGRLAPAIFSYFLQPPEVTGVFPFIHPAAFETTYMGQTIKEVTYGGIFVCLPILWILFFTKPIISIRNNQRSTRTITGVITLLVISGFLVAILDAEMAGILQRYYADFSFMFLSAVVLLVFIANENIPESTSIRSNSKLIIQQGLFRAGLTRELLTKTLIALVAVSVLYSILICFVPETGWYSDIYPWAYHDLIEMIQFWT